MQRGRKVFSSCATTPLDPILTLLHLHLLRDGKCIGKEFAWHIQVQSKQLKLCLLDCEQFFWNVQFFE